MLDEDAVTDAARRLLAADTQARCLRLLEQASSMSTAARAAILAAFTAGQGYAADGDYSSRAWLIHRARVTKGTAVAYTAWVRRAAAHPEVAAAHRAGDSAGGGIGAGVDSARPGALPAVTAWRRPAGPAGQSLPDYRRQYLYVRGQ